MKTITVKGTGNVSARPDYIILSLNIETLSESYDRAMSEAAVKIAKIAWCRCPRWVSQRRLENHEL